MSHRLFEEDEHAELYAKYRIVYPDHVIKEIWSFLAKSEPIYDHLENSTALDVGCGTGHQCARQVKKYFKKVIGVDVSPAMINCAKRANHDPDMDFRISPAEELPVGDNSLALITAAASLHWFDLPKFYKEVDRVLKPGGVIAALCHWFEATVLDHPNATELTRIINEDMYGELLKRGHENKRVNYPRNRYLDEEIQIPYVDRVRRDDINITMPTTIKWCLYDNLSTLSPVREMMKMEPEFYKQWHGGIVSRLFEEDEHAELYAKYRMVYPDHVIREIVTFLAKSESLDYHLENSTALDVGCGTGHQCARQVKKYFKKVIGVDVSPAMIECAKRANHHPDMDFRISPAEELPVADNSLALITAATALHWFDLPKFYKEVDRVLKPGGVVAAFGPSLEVTVLDHPNAVELARIINEELHAELFKRGHDSPRIQLYRKHYVDEEIQIPYADRVRRDDINITMSTTIKWCLYDDFSTSSPAREMLRVEPEYYTQWHNSIVDRFLKTYGSDDINAPLRLQYNVFMIMGRKPGPRQK